MNRRINRNAGSWNRYDVIGDTTSLTIEEGLQMAVFEELTIAGDLIVEGKLRVTS